MILDLPQARGGYLARPPGGSGPGLVLGMSLLGVNAELRRAADHFAALGYVTFAANLFWRMEPDYGPASSPDANARSLDLLKRSDDGVAADDLALLAGALRREPHCAGAVGAVGWCYGGRIAALAAAAGALDAVACFFPTWLETRLDAVARIACPLSIHMAEHEPYARLDRPAERVAAVLTGRPEAALFSYPGTTHGFDFSTAPIYDSAASKLANCRIALMLERALKT